MSLPPVPALPAISDIAPRIRGALSVAANAGRDRITLTLLLALTAVVAAAAFGYLIFRSRRP